jgi:Eco29kI restriction endonuclease
MDSPTAYNPLDRKNLGQSVAEALLGRKPRDLGTLKPFKGAGIYALYYRGPFKSYLRLSMLNENEDPQAPIYVGKAIPKGGRKGDTGILVPKSTSALFNRLREHADSLNQAENLSLGDFTCRFLVVDDIWIPLAEALLIAKFSPIWNVLVDGFGNHDPGKGRYEGMRPRWDVLHPGRSWAMKCKPRPETTTQIASEIESRLSQEPSLVRSRFLAEDARGRYGDVKSN